MITTIRLHRSIAFTALITLSVFGANALADPQVTGVTQTAKGLTNGATLTISGSGFGTKSPAKPYLWAPFDNGSIQPSSLGQQTQWSLIQNMAYSATGGVNGGPAAVSVSPSSPTGDWTLAIDSQGFTWNDLGAKYYVFDKSIKNFDVVNPVSINWKPFRIWSIAASTGYLSQPDFVIGAWNGNIWTEGMTAYGTSEAPPYAYVNGVATPPSILQGPINQWFPEEIIYQVNSTTSSNDGKFWWYVNGALDAQLPVSAGWTTFHLIMRDSMSNEDMTRLFIQGVQENDASFPSTNKFALSDIYIDNTWARVMIGNAPTWSASTTKEIEVPTAWADNSISVVVHNDTFPTLNGEYLYVVDSNGNVNQNGFALCSSCPMPPTNLNVK